MTLEEGEQSIELVLNINLHIVVKQLHRCDALELLSKCLVLSALPILICPAFNAFKVVQANVLILIAHIYTGKVFQLFAYGC